MPPLLPRFLSRLLLFLALALSLALSALPSLGREPSPAAAPLQVQNLPQEARATLDLIRQGGPFPYRRDGITFQNREGRLPARPRGYYREYTVPTPGAADRGARRIISGADPPREFYYTADHYRSFRPIEVRP